MAEFGIQARKDHSVSVYDKYLDMLVEMKPDEEFYGKFETDEEAKLFVTGLRSRGYSRSIKLKATPYREGSMYCYAITVNTVNKEE